MTGSIVLGYVLYWLCGFVALQALRPVRLTVGTVGSAILAILVPMGATGKTSMAQVAGMIGALLALIATAQLAVGSLLSALEFTPDELGRSAHVEVPGVLEWGCELMIAVIWFEQLGHVALWGAATGVVRESWDGQRIIAMLLESALCAFTPLFLLKCMSEAILAYCLKRCGRGDFGSDWRLLRVAILLIFGPALLHGFQGQ